MERPAHKNRPFAIDGLIVQNKKVLFIKRRKWPYENCWAIPGGHVDFDETIEEALKREVNEETNLLVTSYKLLGIYSKPSRSPTQAISAVYIVQTRGRPRAGDDAVDFKWFPLNKLPKNLAFDHKKIIKDYIKSKKDN